jgi:RNA polymerase sigma factor (sigma-70 family)
VASRDAAMGFADGEQALGGALLNAYLAHYQALVRFAMFLLTDATAAHDVVQDVFVNLRVSSPVLDDPTKELAYLRRMVVNGCRALQRRSALTALLPLHARARGSLVGDSADVVVDSAEDLAMATFRRAALVVALRRLPRRKREVVVLRHYCDLSERQVADLLGISRGSVKALSHRGLADLARLMGDPQ